ncbi:uncharacterized protein LOC129219441 isoform X2 [Uloborus diversus]|uniref:uncharacterized protein LOC129219441 isoform X2 n=1 Tax=Uloborus diversus TaxID=327109 RepID=UPI00240A8757|nr:uncharacterized protein LOC129219441 isoform X2 [Uloborus diversus]
MRPFQLTCIDWKSKEKKSNYKQLCFAYKNMKGPIFHRHLNELQERCSCLMSSPGIDVPDVASDKEIVMRILKRPNESSLCSNKKRKEEIPLQEILPLHQCQCINTENIHEKMDYMVTSMDSLSCTINNSW